MELSELRRQIDHIDDQLVDLFCQRMAISTQVANYKKETGMPVYVPAREREIQKKVAQRSGKEMANYTRVLYSMLFELSRSYQSKCNDTLSTLYQEVTKAIGDTPKLFPQDAMVACQGVEGAYSQIAAEKIFKNPFILYFKNFDGVFNAVEQGLCKYGVLPIENSTAGSVNKVYDLMIQKNFSIVRTFRLKVDHNLLVKPGTAMDDIRVIYSHEQAIHQCAEFLSKFPGVNVIPVSNTAVAAEMVAKSERNDTAALSSRGCAELYGLKCLQASVQDKGNNHTRFICISNKLEVYSMPLQKPISVSISRS